MNIIADVETAFKAVNKRRSLIIPSLLLNLVFLGVILSFMFTSGFNGPAGKLLQLSLQYDEYTDGEFRDFLEVNGFDLAAELAPLISIKTAVLFIVHLILLILGAAYLTCATHCAAFNAAKGSKEPIIELTNRMFFKILGTVLLIAFMFIIPSALVIIIGSAGFLINPLIGVLLMLIAICAFLYIITLVCLKTIFALPIILNDKKSPVEAVKKSWNMTNRNLTRVGGVYLALTAVSYFSTGIFAGPAYQAFLTLFVSSNIAVNAFVTLFILIMIILASFASTVSLTYLYVAYNTFKK